LVHVSISPIHCCRILRAQARLVATIRNLWKNGLSNIKVAVACTDPASGLQDDTSDRIG
jgi:hypothetical protein